MQASLNIVVTAAAGNSCGAGGLGLFGSNYPGVLPSVISVGSIDNIPTYISAFTMDVGARTIPYANFSYADAPLETSYFPDGELLLVHFRFSYSISPVTALSVLWVQSRAAICIAAKYWMELWMTRL